MKKNRLLASFLLTISSSLNSQSIKLPFGFDNWDTAGTILNPETYMGKESVLLKSGGIYTKKVDFKDGVIELDMSFPQGRGFPGLGFRMQDLSNFENFYVRPHQSGNPDATQYTPVFNGQAAWQLYYGDGYSKAFTFSFNAWHHIKIDVHGLQAEIYIDDMQTPLYKVSELKREWKGGNIALISGGTAVHFANVQYTPKQATPPVAAPVPANGTNGMITRWQLSNVVDRSLFEKEYQLNPGLKEKFTWTTQTSESSGIINFSRFGLLAEKANTMVAKVVIESSTEQVKALTFGFSDYVTVYLNDKALYYGADNFMSRDYRFLGTVGFFDTLFLPLKKGENELWFVVSENFGGWGVQAKFENMENISMK